MTNMLNRQLAVLICALGALSVAARGPACVAQGNDAQLRSMVQHRLQVGKGGGKICSVAQVDLPDERNHTVLASIDWSGRGFCNDVWLLDPNSAGDQHFDAWNAEDVSKLIVSLGAPGEKQLAVPRAWSQYNGAQCVAKWTAIYSQRGGKMVDDSASFPAFYQNRLKALQARLEHGDAEPECTQMEADRVSRFLGISPKAGFDLARSWVQSSDPSLRAKGVAVLGDIGDEPSRRELQKISAGESPEAVLARRFLVARTAK